MNNTNKIKTAIQNKNLINTIRIAVDNRWGLRYIFDTDIRSRHQEYKTRVFIEKKYKVILSELQDREVEENTELPKIIWWCWFQGEDNAPDIVKACLESVRRNFPDYKVNIITSENMCEYASIPEYILEKYNKGIICAANFSDYLRNQLLLQHGGIWLDSTVFCTGNEMAKVFERAPLFMYKDMTDQNACISSWLIVARQNDPLLLGAKRILDEYWKRYNVSKNYYLYHIIITCVAREMTKYWDSIPLFDNCGPHVLSKEINEIYDENRVKDIKRLSDFHKLNYKVDFVEDKDTNYKVIVGNCYGHKE